VALFDVEEVNHLIRLEKVCKEYKAGQETIRALGPVNIKIKASEKVAVVGPSGAGKSTLLNILGLLEPSTSGTYYLEDTDTTIYGENDMAFIRRDKIGFVFQRYNLIEELDIQHNIALPLVYRGWSAKQRRTAVEEALAAVGLSMGKSRLKPAQLSGGEQQRVAIARAIVGNPRILLADEPTGNLDSITGQQIVDLLIQLHRAGQQGVLVIVTHNMQVARQMDRMITLCDGRIEESSAELATCGGS
jgi:putative ABC transport system ATP-binding protein